MNHLVKNIELGSGLIGIGRKWGAIDSPVPTEKEVNEFLPFAIKKGIFYFDTAPAYGTSEERLGKFLKRLESTKREQLIISTKFGEHWDTDKNAAYVDHSYERLKQSLDESLDRLGNIDLLYLHKAHIAALQSPDVTKAFAYAKSQGIEYFGASVSDIESANYVLKSDFYSYIQLPYNVANMTFDAIIDKATQNGKIVVINRPFNMGHHAEDKVEAFKFILKKKFNGFILTGTKSPRHLQENLEAFAAANEQT